jgi:predicted ATPase/DNA-binding XRE family transcriptional regulator
MPHSAAGCARRRMIDLTQDDLARQVGCSVATIRKLEADERRPSLQIANRLADILEIAPADRAAFLALARAEPFLDPAPPPAGNVSGRPPPRPPSNLLAPLTRLIGRKQDVAAIRNVLGRGATRLLTLIGPPGIGKTRLSIAAAQEVRASFADGVYFVALAPIGDPALVIATIAQTLDVQETGTLSLEDQLRLYLRNKHMLLLLDNFEHLLAAAPLVTELLIVSPGLHVLATSRAALHVHGERLFPVPPLVLPDLLRLPAVENLARTPAVALFVACAQARVPDFVLTAENAAPVAELCVRLDGLPLAIELAAARVARFTPLALAARLAGRLGASSMALLTNGPRDLPPRHQTLRGAIAWSYELLAADEQRLFRRLGVFVDGCTSDVVEGVCDLISERSADVRDQLAALIDNSLLQQTGNVDGEPRYTMLETIREYALERLIECGEEMTFRQRHATWFVALAERADPEMRGAEQKIWFDRLEQEHSNLRAALEWSRSAPDGAELGVRLTGALGWFWFRMEIIAKHACGWKWQSSAVPARDRDPRRRHARRCISGRERSRGIMQTIMRGRPCSYRQAWRFTAKPGTRVAWPKHWLSLGGWRVFKVITNARASLRSKVWRCTANRGIPGASRIAFGVWGWWRPIRVTPRWRQPGIRRR